MGMQWLELKIPPLLVGFVFAGVMLGVAYCAPGLSFTLAGSPAIALALGALGGSVALAGVIAFRPKRTTTNPLTPSAASYVVSRGIYSVSRNPMYLGAGCALAGAALFYETVVLWAYAGAFLLLVHCVVVWYEEPTLRRTFDGDYEQYCRKVRRWLPVP